MSASTQYPAVRFSRFELLPDERRLLDNGRPLPLGARAFDVLTTLIDGGGDLVTKAELMDRVWPGVVVEENNIAVQVNALRKALGGDIIVTIPGRGYRFAALMQLAPDAHTTISSALPAKTTTPDVSSEARAATDARTRLFGRDDDLAGVSSALETIGCLTLVGSAGIGKTRLARALIAQWSGRSVWVDLATLTDPSLIPVALAHAVNAQLAE